VTHSNGVYAALRATATIPIVFATGGDAVVQGIVASLARPGGIVTGLTFFLPELMAKRLELLKQTVPSMDRAGVLLLRDQPLNGPVLAAMRATVGALGVELHPLEVRDPSEFEGAFSIWVARRIGAFVIHDHALFIVNAGSLVLLGAKYGLPSVGPLEIATNGGLMAYGVDFPTMFRRAAVFVGKILKGAKPGDLPVERATRFNLLINLRTACARPDRPARTLRPRRRGDRMRRRLDARGRPVSSRRARRGSHRQRDALALRRPGEIGVERGEGQRAAEGELEIGGVVEREAVTLREPARLGPGAQVSLGVDLDRVVREIRDDAIGVRTRQPLATDGHLQAVRDLDVPEPRHHRAASGDRVEQRGDRLAALVVQRVGERDRAVEHHAHRRPSAIQPLISSAVTGTSRLRRAAMRLPAARARSTSAPRPTPRSTAAGWPWRVMTISSPAAARWTSSESFCLASNKPMRIIQVSQSGFYLDDLCGRVEAPRAAFAAAEVIE